MTISQIEYLETCIINNKPIYKLKTDGVKTFLLIASKGISADAMMISMCACLKLKSFPQKYRYP